MSDSEDYSVVEEHKDFKVVLSKKEKRIRMSDYKPLKGASGVSNVRAIMSSLISDQEPVVSGPPNPVIDLDQLSIASFVQLAEQTMSSTNPTGRPPPGAPKGTPDMAVLIDYLQVNEMAERQSYASVAHSVIGLSSPSESISSSLSAPLEPKTSPNRLKTALKPSVRAPTKSKGQAPKPNVSFQVQQSLTMESVPGKDRFSFPPGRAQAAAAKALAKEKKAASLLRQCGVTTTRLPEVIIPGKRYCPTEKYGNFVGKGKKTIATSRRKKKCASTSSDEDSPSSVSDANDVALTSTPSQKMTQHVQPLAAFMSDSLIPASALDHTQPALLSAAFDTTTLLPAAQLGVHSDVAITTVDEERIDDISDSDSDIDVALTLIETHLMNESHVTSGQNSLQFQRFCRDVPPLVSKYPYPPDEPGFCLSPSACHTILPQGTDAEHVMSGTEQDLCNGELTRAKLVYLYWNFLHGLKSVAELRDKVMAVTSATHPYLVVLGGAFTNSVWSSNNTLQHDRQLFYDVVSEHGVIQFDTYTPDFAKVPLGSLSANLLLTLPIKAIFGYLHHHRVPIRLIPWNIIQQQNGDLMESLPTNTQPPFDIWMQYLLVLLEFVHQAMRNRDHAYPIMYQQFRSTTVASLTDYDADVFLETHFPLEAATLSHDRKPRDSVALLERANAFALQIKYRLDVYNACSLKWAAFLYYLVHNKFPHLDAVTSYDIPLCIAGLTDTDSDKHRRLIDFPTLLVGNPLSMYALLCEHPLAKRLYGPIVQPVPLGLLRLMIMGLVYKHVQIATGQHNIDKVIPAAFLAYFLYSKGVLSPTSPQETPFASSSLFPVLQLTSAMATIERIINTKNIVALTLPPSNISLDFSNAQYQRHYDRLHAQCIVSSLQHTEWTTCQRMITPITAFYDGSCLFPQQRVAKAAADAVLQPSDYLFAAGQRLMTQLAAITISALTAVPQASVQASPGPSGPRIRDSTVKSPQRQSTLIVTAAGVVANYTAAKRRVLAELLATNSGVVTQSATALPLMQTLPNTSSSRPAPLPPLPNVSAQPKPAPLPPLPNVSAQPSLGPVIKPRFQSAQRSQHNDRYKSTSLVADWTNVDFADKDFLRPYFKHFTFHTVSSRPVEEGDSLLLLKHEPDQRHKGTSQLRFMKDYSHVLYTFRKRETSASHTCLLDYADLIHTPQHVEYLEGYFALHIQLIIDSAYILFEGDNDQHATSSVSSPANPGAQATDYDKDTESGSDDDTSLSSASDSKPRDRKRRRHEDSGSEDSDARKITKVTMMKYGSSEPIPVIGKTKEFERVQKTVVLRKMSVKGHLARILRAVGVYTHTLETKAIMEGLINNPPTDADFNMSNLGVTMDHNKHKLMNLAWYHHPELHDNVVHLRSNLTHTMGVNSVHSCHFMTLADAIRTNYKIVTYTDFVNHLIGWRITWQELLGQPYGTLLQTIITEVQNAQIGEHCNVAYLVALADRWRAQLHHYACSDAAFYIDGHTEPHYPDTMDAADWISLMEKQWDEFKRNISVAKQLEYLHMQSAYQLKPPVPFGQKVKAVVPPLIKAGQAAKPITPVAAAKKVAAQAGRKERVKKDIKVKRPQSPEDADYNVCIADLLQHYGANQQAVCQSPCPYLHYKDIPQGTAKDAVVRKLEFLRKKFSLSDETVQFIAKKVASDKKFK